MIAQWPMTMFLLFRWVFLCLMLVPDGTTHFDKILPSSSFALNTVRKAASEVNTCTEAALDSALSTATDGAIIAFTCSGTLRITATKTISLRLTLDAKGKIVILSGKSLIFKIDKQAALTISHLSIVGDKRDTIGIANDGALAVTDSRIEDNSTGIINNGQARIFRSVFTGNRQAAIYNSGTLDVRQSLIMANGRGLDNASGNAVIANSTFFGNLVPRDREIGGAIANSGTLLVLNSTFSGNVAPGGGGAIGNHWGGEVTVKNTILANSNRQWSCFGPVSDGGHNIQFPGGSCGPTIPTLDPRLLPLADNGGPTQTMALLRGSPAIGVGDKSTCADSHVSHIDQRGYLRPRCDIGSYEAAAPVWIYNELISWARTTND
jgi:hypothetical protein